MGIFDNKKSISRSKFREVLRRTPMRSTSSARGYTHRERVNLEREVFGPKYGGQISKRDYRTALGKMHGDRFKAKNSVERREIERKIRYLKRIGGEEHKK